MVEAGKYFCYSLLTASNLELTRVVIKRIIIKHHPTGYCNTNTKIILHQIFFSGEHHSPKLIVDCLILAHPNTWHLLQHSLPTKRLETIYFQLWIPEILQCFWRLIHLLKQKKNHFNIITTKFLHLLVQFCLHPIPQQFRWSQVLVPATSQQSTCGSSLTEIIFNFIIKYFL